MVTRALVVGAILTTTLAQAHAFCSPPSAPFCASSFGTFDNRSDFERCRREMEYYRDDVDRYLTCLRSEGDQVRRQYNDAVESFNRRARG